VAIPFEEGFQAEAIGMVLGVLCFAAGKIAFGEAYIIYSIEQIGLTGAVAAGDADDAFIEGETFPGVIFKLNK
jgi:hypothetical protein